MPAVGSQIALGNGALLTFVAVNGAIIGGGAVAVSDENDRSIAVLVQYGGFDFLWASDLGGGSNDGACTGRSTSQTDVESAVIQAISPGGAAPMISSGGIDVLHTNHHGSESSTNSNWMNYARPALAVVSVGAGETTGWDLPRKDVVEHVLLAQSAGCITAPPALVLQTEEGSPAGVNTSLSGYCVGDIRITTDGQTTFAVDADGQVNQGPNEVAAAGLPRTMLLDDDRVAPTTSITAPAAGAQVTGTVSVTASAADDRAVTRVEFLLDGVVKATVATAPYAWSWSTVGAAGGHTLQSRAYDAAGNIGSSAIVSVTVLASNLDTTAPTAPTNLAATAGKRQIALKWTASTDNVGVTGYKVFRSSTVGGTYTNIATTSSTSYTNSSLKTGTKWFYLVKATDAAGNISAASSVVSATTL